MDPFITFFPMSLFTKAQSLWVINPEIFLYIFNVWSCLLVAMRSCGLMHPFMSHLLWQVLSDTNKTHFDSRVNNTQIKSVIEEPFKQFEWTRCFCFIQLIKQQVFLLSVQNRSVFMVNSIVQDFGNIFSTRRQRNILAPILPVHCRDLLHWHFGNTLIP